MYAVFRSAVWLTELIADGIGVPHTTVRNWSVGRIEIPATARPALASSLRSHTQRLEAAALVLEG